MGLDTVELVLQLEDEFEVEISNEEATGIVTVGELVNCVTQLVRARGSDAQEDLVFSRIREILIDSYGVQPSSITMNAQIVKELGLD